MLVLCVAAAWFLISALRESGEPGGVCASTYVGGCDSVLVVYALNQAIQTDNGKFHVTIYQSAFHRFE